MLKSRLHPVTRNEQGFASIVIALLLIIILALLTVGFAQLSRREQQNALDKQLNNQAYYAAESGVNDALKAIKDATLVTQLTNTPTECYGSPSSGLPKLPGTTTNVVNSSSGVQYTCVMVDLHPTTLVKDLLANNDWTTVFVPSSTPDSLTVTWNSKEGRQPSTDVNHKFTPQSSWNYPAVLQFSITPLNALDRNSLMTNTYTAYMYPSTDSPASTPSYTNVVSSQGQIIPGTCDNTGKCSVTITGGFNSTPLTPYLMHILDYYDDSHVVVGALTAGVPVHFSGSQAVIDSTGQDKNVLKRIQVHVPIFPQPDLPSYAIEAQNVCKRFTTYPTSPTQSQNTVWPPTSLPAGFDTSSCGL